MFETFRILKPGGYVYATYGPLWFCFGGDHYSGRGGTVRGYSHIELSHEEYSEYFSLHKQPHEDAQSGGRYVELDLFSKLTTMEYLALYEKAGFKVADLMLEVSRPAQEFRDAWPDRYQRILHAHPHILPEDLLIKSNFVILRKPASGN